MHKTWLHTFALSLLFGGIIAKLRSAIANHVPVGYQDESGFHLGVKQTQDRWPANLVNSGKLLMTCGWGLQG